MCTSCTNLSISATDAPDLSKTTNLSRMFHRALKFNQPLDFWNVSNVTNMKAMFQEARSFNKPLASWNVSNVTNMILSSASKSIYGREPLRPHQLI